MVVVELEREGTGFEGVCFCSGGGSGAGEEGLLERSLCRNVILLRKTEGAERYVVEGERLDSAGAQPVLP